MEYVISIGHKCKAFLGLVQRGSHCDINVDIDGHVYNKHDAWSPYAVQTAVYIADISVGNHTIRIIPVGAHTNNVCRLASFFCVRQKSAMY